MKNVEKKIRKYSMICKI